MAPPLSWERHREVLARVRLLALDVDGVLTDGRIVYAGDEELQSFHVHDGQGLRWLLRAGVEVAWISARGCRATEKRAAELGVRELHLRVADKRAALARVQQRLGVTPAQTLAVGDDAADLELAALCALFVCPPNASDAARARAGAITAAAGGAGCVREVAEALLYAKGVWEEVTGLGGAAPR